MVRFNEISHDLALEVSEGFKIPVGALKLANHGKMTGGQQPFSMLARSFWFRLRLVLRSRRTRTIRSRPSEGKSASSYSMASMRRRLRLSLLGSWGWDAFLSSSARGRDPLSGSFSCVSLFPR